MDNPENVLDVRSILMAGESPFPAVEARVQAMEPGQKLVLITPFEPTPLYDFFEGWHVHYKTSTSPEGYRVEIEKDELEARVPRFLDLRNLPPPEPFQKTMEAYRELSPGSCLVVHVPHRPLPLLEHLDSNGIPWEDQPQPDGSCHVYILKEDT